MVLYVNFSESFITDLLDNAGRPQTYGDYFVETKVAEADKDKDILVVHAGFTTEPSLELFREKLPDRIFSVGIAEQHAVTFAPGLLCGGLKLFCIIPSSFLQRAYDQNCIKARSLLAKLGVEVIVADARFCKPLDIKLLR
ncbi:unnamed protein product [Trifolium pratense]|uniref:Uncharacterized protein n=1 Tax=Trifolium pratense TaxID=57577 RepID=A0ACB0IEJ2_TRIPR|nr:unnamed protein product [Trifolium pratense]